LASFDGVDFGVFGFCNGDTCSNVEIGYSTGELEFLRRIAFYAGFRAWVLHSACQVQN
jgi:hypothetical protein